MLTALLCLLAPAGEPRVLILGIDGLRPDALAAAETPHLDRLRGAGTYFSATDIRKPDRMAEADTVSGPGWCNVLTGVFPDKHAVLDNGFENHRLADFPHVFARLKQARPDARAAQFATWKPLEEIVLSAADASGDFSPDKKDYTLDDYEQSDAAAADAAVAELTDHDPTLLILYQGQTDVAGHKHGFHPTIKKYVSAIETVDAAVGRVLAAVESRPGRADEDWLVIVCTDHGGIGTGHGGGHNAPDVRGVFLIVSGDGAARGVSEEPTYQVDVVATALKHLGVDPPEDWKLDGHPVGLN